MEEVAFVLTGRREVGFGLNKDSAFHCIWYNIFGMPDWIAGLDCYNPKRIFESGLQSNFRLGFFKPDLKSNPFQSNPFQSNLFQSNPFQSNPFQSNLLQSNPFQYNLFQSNPFQSNPFQSVYCIPVNPLNSSQSIAFQSVHCIPVSPLHSSQSIAF
jgi:hypothetical protein